MVAIPPTRSGPVAQLGAHYIRIVGVVGSNPIRSTKKEVTFVYQKLLLFLSKPQAWHIIKGGKPTLYLITRQRAYHHGKAVYKPLPAA